MDPSLFATEEARPVHRRGLFPGCAGVADRERAELAQGKSEAGKAPP
jgi:hypothetical protein